MRSTDTFHHGLTEIYAVERRMFRWFIMPVVERSDKQLDKWTDRYGAEGVVHKLVSLQWQVVGAIWFGLGLVGVRLGLSDLNLASEITCTMGIVAAALGWNRSWRAKDYERMLSKSK